MNVLELRTPVGQFIVLFVFELQRSMKYKMFLYFFHRQLLCPALIQLLGSPLTDLNKRPKTGTQFPEEINRGGRGTGNFPKSTSIVGPIPRTIYNIATELLRLVGPLAAMRPVLESLFHRIILYPPAQQRTEALKALKEVPFMLADQVPDSHRVPSLTCYGIVNRNLKLIERLGLRGPSSISLENPFLSTVKVCPVYSFT